MSRFDSLIFATLSAFLLSAFILLSSNFSHAAQKQVGAVCKGDSSAYDWDALAQCDGARFIKAPLILGAALSPPYATTACQSDKAGMIQWTGSAFQGCDGNKWINLSGGASGAMPQGTVAFFALTACPEGWVLADGTNGTYDLRGEFIRALDNGRGLDAGRTLGSQQKQDIQSHTHMFLWGQNAGTSGKTVFGNSIAHYGNYGLSATNIEETGGIETRPRNIALLACQKN